MMSSLAWRSQAALHGLRSRRRPQADSEKVFVAAHGNSIRAIVKYLEDLADDVIPGLKIP